MKYPKFFLLLLTFIFAYIILESTTILPLRDTIVSLGFAGAFLAGVFYAFGLTAAPATALIIVIGQRHDILLTALVVGGGAVVGDLTIFRFIRYSFNDEIEKFREERVMRVLRSRLSRRVTHYLLPMLAFLIIASPLPDEIGVSLLASLKDISEKKFIFLSFILNTLGIIGILALWQTPGV